MSDRNTPEFRDEIVRETRRKKYIRSSTMDKVESVPNTTFCPIEKENLDRVHKLKLGRPQQQNTNGEVRSINLIKSPRRRPRGNIRMPRLILPETKTESGNALKFTVI